MVLPTITLPVNVNMMLSNTTFLRASDMLKHVIDIGWTSFRLSVCLSVSHTLALHQNG